MCPGAPLAVMGFHSVCAQLIQHIFVAAQFGEAAYRAGVRMMAKQGVYTNGHPTPGWAIVPFLLLMLTDALILIFVLKVGSYVATSTVWRLRE